MLASSITQIAGVPSKAWMSLNSRPKAKEREITRWFAGLNSKPVNGSYWEVEGEAQGPNASPQALLRLHATLSKHFFTTGYFPLNLEFLDVSLNMIIKFRGDLLRAIMLFLSWLRTVMSTSINLALQRCTEVPHFRGGGWEFCTLNCTESVNLRPQYKAKGWTLEKHKPQL